MTAKKKSSAKATKKATKAAPVAAKTPGVISTIVEALQNPKGATREQILAILVRKFPDRKPEGMNATIGVQTGRLGATKEKTTDGTIYSLKK